MEIIQSKARKAGLDRSTSEVHSHKPHDEPDRVYRTVGSTSHTQWQKEKRPTRGSHVLNINGGSRHLNALDLSPTDELVYFDSYDELTSQRNSIDIYKENLTKDFVVYVQSNVSNQEYLDDIEQGRITAENVSVYSDKTQLEKNIILLWAAFLGKTELFPGLVQCGADIHCCDANGFTPLHICAYKGNVAGCEYFLSQGANVNHIKDKYTPLHCAAFGDAPKVVKLLLGKGAKVEYYKDGVVGEGTALHSAVKANAVECLHLLMQEGADVNSIEPGGWSPLHTAADLGSTESMKLMLDSKGIKLNVKTRDKDSTPLHLAAENGYKDCVSLLLSRGANPDEQNSHGQTPLHLAARAQAIECVGTLLGCKECDVNARDDDRRTPLHSAVGKEARDHEIVRLLLNHQADVDARDKYGCTPLHIAALNEQSDCVSELLEHDADLGACTNAGTTALSIVSRKIPACLEVFYKKMDKSITIHDGEGSHRDVELKLDFRPLLQHSKEGEVGFIKMFIDEGQKEILEHPLCQAFLYVKWKKIRKYFYVRLLFWFLLTVSYTAYMYSIAHLCYKPIENKLMIWDQFVMHEDAISPQWYILLFLTLFETGRKLYSVSSYTGVKDYVKIPENFMEWYVILSIYIMLSSYADCITPWQQVIGSTGILVAWTNMMFKLGQLPFFGSYVSMFLRVQKDFIKLFLAYSCLLIGFTISFCVILPTSDEFTYPHTGFLKVLVMMTGELNLINFLVVERAGVNVIFILLFLVFVLFVTIVLMNLLVGIAVHDIQGLQKTAGILKLENQTRLISHIESSLFNIHFHLPKYFVHMLRDTALLSPSAYRVVLHVKPHNPREKRLPKDLLQMLYRHSQRRKSSKRTQQTVSNAKAGDEKTLIHSNNTIKVEELTSRLEAVSQSNVDVAKEVMELRRIITAFIDTFQNQENVTKN
ncbi:transient receptor potential channel pyrexia [Anabrus simplex]|uniref:transient receptor potential channel pyrexia n=1 Tax=Anabrus simplex TaxID=316456 RepID=UPI0035A2E6DA